MAVCGEEGVSISVSVSALSQHHTEPCYSYPNNHSIHTECTWLTPPPATGIATRGNLTGIQTVCSITVTFYGGVNVERCFWCEQPLLQ